MINFSQNKASNKIMANFRESVDNILCYKALFPTAGRNEIDGYLARLKYHQRFGKSLQDARDLAFFNEIDPY